MRWLLVLGFLFEVTRAEARIVVMEPPVQHNCRADTTFEKVLDCLKKIGKTTVLRDLPNAKLVALADNGVYLYVKRAPNWTLGGQYEAPISLIDLKPVTINQHLGYRIDFGLGITTSIALDQSGGVATAAIRTRHALFCSGEQYYCVDALLQCDVLVHGRSYYTFRGTLAIEDENVVHVTGDRTRAGPSCDAQEKQYLGWPIPAPPPRPRRP